MTASPGQGTPPPTATLDRRVVRGHGSGVLHVADVHPDQFYVAKWIGPAFVGVELPLATACGSILRGDVAVCMKGGSSVKCRRCRRITGVETAAEGNELLNGYTGEQMWIEGAPR